MASTITSTPSRAAAALATRRNAASPPVACSRCVAWNTKCGTAKAVNAMPAGSTKAPCGRTNATMSSTAMPSVAPPKSRA
jgi:hypothetical protein